MTSLGDGAGTMTQGLETILAGMPSLEKMRVFSAAEREPARAAGATRQEAEAA